MTEPSRPIPTELAEAFRDAVGLFRDWSPGLPKAIEVSVKGKSYSMSEVCHLVDHFSGQLPQDVFDALLSYMHAPHTDLRRELVSDRSYATGARCLVKLIGDRKAEYQQQEELRRNR
jgi:hypothetical protein